MADLWGAALADAPEPAFRPGNLATKFLQPPFSVLNTRSGDWQERRRSWLSLGIQSELGRDGVSFLHAQDKLNAILGSDSYQVNSNDGGTSVFDPVLCELAYRWWAPEGGAVLDPFAGGSVRGIVAAKLGHPYTGVDLSAPQLEANRAQADAILQAGEPVPHWVSGDSREVLAHLPDDQLFDMVFSCPPYYDLEVYSDDPTDLSAMSWHDFLVAYEAIIEHATAHLRPERFAVFVVTEVRDKDGYYRGLVPRTIGAFERVGMRFYNDAVLVNSAGTLPLRVTRQFEAGRKLGRIHQNVLCFVKGKPPRGWSYDRAAPPSPQLSLLVPEVDESDHQAVPPEDGPSADEVQLLVPSATLLGSGPTRAALAPVDPDQDGDGWCAACGHHHGGPCSDCPECPPVVPTVCEDHEPGYHATIQEAAVCSAETYGEPVDARGLHLDQQPDGRWVDQATGELLEADRVTPAPPLTLAPDDWVARREELWRADDPQRQCWTCGAEPTGAYRDGSPAYACTHPVDGQTSLFGGDA